MHLPRTSRHLPPMALPTSPIPTESLTLTSAPKVALMIHDFQYGAHVGTLSKKTNRTTSVWPWVRAPREMPNSSRWPRKAVTRPCCARLLAETLDREFAPNPALRVCGGLKIETLDWSPTIPSSDRARWLKCCCEQIKRAVLFKDMSFRAERPPSSLPDRWRFSCSPWIKRCR